MAFNISDRQTAMTTIARFGNLIEIREQLDLIMVRTQQVSF